MRLVDGLVMSEPGEVAPQFGERPGLLPFAVTQNPRHG